MAGRVTVVTPDGQVGTVDAVDVDNMPSGSRVLTEQEATEARLDAEYAKASTGQKIAGAAGFLGPIGWGVSALGKGALPPQLDAYRQGVASGASAGLYQAVAKEATDAVEGPAAGRAYAAHQDSLSEAFPTTHAAGAVVGILAPAIASGGATAAAATPAGALGVAGEALEQGVVRGLGGLAGKGVIGRAATQGAAMAVRGAAEGAAYAGIDQAASSVLHDEPITGEKLYAAVGHGALIGGGLGAALGVGGSLAGSGVRAAASRVGKAFGRAEEGIGEVSKEPAMLESGGLAEEAAPAAKAPSPGIMSALEDPGNAARGMAQEQAWKAVGAGFGLQTTRYAKEAARYFPNGTKDLGEIALRYGLVDMGEAGGSPLSAAWQAAKSGTPAEIAPRAEMALEGVGNKIGEITDASGARVSGQQIADAMASVVKDYSGAAATKPIAQSIHNFGADILESLGLNTPEATASVQSLLKERRAIDQLVFRDSPTLDPKTLLRAKRELSSKLEGVIADVMDEASGRLPGELRADYTKLKKDYHGLRILSEAAEDSAARSSKRATFGFSETAAAAGALAGGHFAAAPVLAIGGKMLKERGNAAAAAFLSRAAERGSFEQVVRSFNARLQKSAAGVLTEGNVQNATRPSAKISPSRAVSATVGREQRRSEMESAQAKAREIVKWVGAHQENPQRIADQVEEAASIIGQSTGPKAAQAYTAATVNAINFVAAHIPIKERADPLDPRSVPPLTHDEATTLIQAAKYALRPDSVFEDFGKGIVTPVGLRAAKTLAPESLMEFRLDLQAHVERHMLANKKLTMSQRLRIDKLLGFAAGADLRPETIARRQALLVTEPLTMPGPAAPPPQGPGPINMTLPSNGFDKIEQRASG